MEHKVLLQESCEKMGVSLTEEMASQFMTYLSLLLEWNEKMNLTAITDKKDVVQKNGDFLAESTASSSRKAL